jgi:hypothetical protein
LQFGYPNVRYTSADPSPACAGGGTPYAIAGNSAQTDGNLRGSREAHGPSHQRKSPHIRRPVAHGTGQAAESEFPERVVRTHLDPPQGNEYSWAPGVTPRAASKNECRTQVSRVRAGLGPCSACLYGARTTGHSQDPPGVRFLLPRVERRASIAGYRGEAGGSPVTHRWGTHRFSRLPEINAEPLPPRTSPRRASSHRVVAS